MDNKAYKVALVDDEYLVREIIISKVDWQSLNCEVVLSANSALEVLDYIDEYDIDILLADINMPVINGLELAKKVKAINPHIRVIMLTGFDEFEYAKKGIDIGVNGYLLKPVDGQLIGEELNKVIMSIEKDVKERSALTKVMHKLENDKPLLKEKFLLDFFHGLVAGNDLEAKYSYFEINMQAPSYQLVLIEFKEKRGSLDQAIGLYGVLYQWKMVLSELLNGHVFSDYNRRIYILNDQEDAIMAEDLMFIMKGIHDNEAYDVMIGVSAQHDSLYEHKSMLSEAVAATNYSAVKGLNTVCHYEETGMSRNGTKDIGYVQSTNIADILDKLKLYVQSGLKEEMHSAINDYLEAVEHLMNLEPSRGLNVLKSEMTMMVAGLNQVIFSMSEVVQEHIHQSLTENDFNPSSAINHIQSLPEAKSIMDLFLTIIIECTEEERHKTSLDIVDKVNAYMDEHYCDAEFTLKETAEIFYVNPDYLSRIYKKKMGISFKEQVFKKRMEKALELIKHSDLRSYQIGEAIGIIDPNYFSVCFRKYMNMSISDYKKRLKEEKA